MDPVTQIRLLAFGGLIVIFGLSLAFGAALTWLSNRRDRHALDSVQQHDVAALPPGARALEPV